MKTQIKDARVEFKTTKEVKELLQDVAHSLGMDLSSFIVSTLTQKALEIKKEEQLLALSEREWEKFNNYLNSNKKPSKNLKELMGLEDFNE